MSTRETSRISIATEDLLRLVQFAQQRHIQGMSFLASVNADLLGRFDKDDAPLLADAIDTFILKAEGANQKLTTRLADSALTRMACLVMEEQRRLDRAGASDEDRFAAETLAVIFEDMREAADAFSSFLRRAKEAKEKGDTNQAANQMSAIASAIGRALNIGQAQTEATNETVKPVRDTEKELSDTTIDEQGNIGHRKERKRR